MPEAPTPLHEPPAIETACCISAALVMELRPVASQPDEPHVALHDARGAPGDGGQPCGDLL